MADLEKHAFKRDNRFLVRLVLALVVAAMFGVFIFAKLTDPTIASCAADAFRSASEDDTERRPEP